MKLLFVLHDFLPEHVGGSEVHCAQLAQELHSRGVEVAIACTERDLSREPGSLLERRFGELRVIEVSHDREYACLEESYEEPRQSVLFDALLERERPDVLHVQHFAQWGSGILARAAARGVPSLATLHDFHLLCANACLLRPDGTSCDGECSACLSGLPKSREPKVDLDGAALARRSQHARDLRFLFAAIAPSRFLAELFARRGMLAGERIVVIESGSQGPWREPVRSDASKPLRLAYIGGLYPSKGVHVLLDAFARLPAGRATLDVHGVLEWFPSYVSHLRRMAEGRDVRFHGRFEPEQIDAKLDDADVLVVPSLWHENRPLTIQAAFRRGVCVLASDGGGCAELVAPGRGGQCVPRGDAAALARAIDELAGDRARLYAWACARPRLASIREVADRHLDLYARAVAQSRR